jgi:hypothetical protein
MLSPSVYWVKNIGPWNIALAPRPRGGEDLDEEIFALRAAGVDLVVSLLEAAEIRELDLADRLTKKHVAKETKSPFAISLFRIAASRNTRAISTRVLRHSLEKLKRANPCWSIAAQA